MDQRPARPPVREGVRGEHGRVRAAGAPGLPLVQRLFYALADRRRPARRPGAGRRRLAGRRRREPDRRRRAGRAHPGQGRPLLAGRPRRRLRRAGVRGRAVRDRLPLAPRLPPGPPARRRAARADGGDPGQAVLGQRPDRGGGARAVRGQRAPRLRVRDGVREDARRLRRRPRRGQHRGRLGRPALAVQGEARGRARPDVRDRRRDRPLPPRQLGRRRVRAGRGGARPVGHGRRRGADGGADRGGR